MWITKTPRDKGSAFLVFEFVDATEDPPVKVKGHHIPGVLSGCCRDCVLE